MIKEGEEKPLKQVPDQKQASSGNGGAGGNGRQAKKQTKNRPRQPRKPRPNQGIFYKELHFCKVECVLLRVISSDQDAPNFIFYQPYLL